MIKKPGRLEKSPNGLVKIQFHPHYNFILPEKTTHQIPVCPDTGP